MPVLMHCGAADHSWRWRTSSEAYGNCYVTIGREVHKVGNIHNDCSRKLRELGEELLETRACLELARVSGAKVPRPRTAGPFYTGSMYAGSPKIGDCDCKNKPPAACGNPFRTVHATEFNGGQRHDPQFLDDHIKTCHPRLVKRLQPKLPYSNNKSDHGKKPGARTVRSGSAYGTFYGS